MRLLHTADWHIQPAKAAESFLALDTIGEVAEEKRVDLIIAAGDTWNSTVHNTAGNLFSEFTERIRRLADITPVVTIYGTPSHDIAGSLEILEQLENMHGITVLRPGVAYFYRAGFIASGKRTEVDQLLIFGVPEPSKKWIAQWVGNKEAAGFGGREALRSLFLGLAAIRKEHPDLPCLLVYHGEIAGATSGTGYQSEAGTGLVVTREDIEMVGADYVACGHIHEPQMIGKNISYAGSAYPQNWGETHQAGVNIVEFKDMGPFMGGEKVYSPSIKRIDLPFPQRMKIELDFANIEDRLDDYEYTGRMVWLEITCIQDVANSGFDPKQLEKHIIHDGALEGSRVTLNILPTETVRAEEIAEAQRLRDKVKVWAESSGDDPDDSILEKADDLEEEATRSGQAGDGAHVRIDRLDLRGSIGIWKGTGLDTISIDFADYDPGLIALIGSNGKGKTTLIENMHPWNQMLTREGKLQDHFRLRDSYRDLYFTDERSDKQYRALMQIDGQNKSGSVDYYLYRWNGAEWEPLAGINGRKEPYIEAVEDLYGSLQLYLRSAFISQRPTKGNPDLSDATKGERKGLFRELAGLDYLQDYSDRAKEKAKALDGEIATDTGRLETLDNLIQGIPELEGRIVDGKKALKDIDSQIADSGRAVEKLTYDHKAAVTRLEAAREIARQIADTQKRLEELEREKRENETTAESYRTALEKRDSAKKAIGEYERLTAEKADLQLQYQAHLKAEKKILDEWNVECAGIRTQRDELKNEADNKRSQAHEQQLVMAKIASQIEGLEKELEKPIGETCPTCGQSWPEDRRQEWLEERKQKEGRLDELHAQAQKMGKEQAELVNAITEVQKRIDAIVDPPKPETPEWDPEPLEKIEAGLEWIVIEAEREILQKADVAEAKLEGIQQRDDAISAEVRKLAITLEGLRKKVDPKAEDEEDQAREALEKVRDLLAEQKENKARYQARLEELEGQLAELEEKKAETKKLRERLRENRKTIVAWQYLQKACGPDGIQALELDALAPSIAMVANRLLQAAYDSRFRVEFRTTRIGGSGSKVKQMETFDVYIHDTEAGTEQELKTLSGGEGVWIKKAIYDAFGIIRAQNTGTSFLTCFQDEADGALDPEARERYFRMLEAAHNESGRRHTIVITHSREIQEMIEQRIVMDELVEAKEAVAV